MEKTKFIYLFDVDGSYLGMGEVETSYICAKGETDVRYPDGLYNAKFNGTQWIETGEPPEPNIIYLKEQKLQEINKLCEQEIYNGIDIQTSKGLKHFNFNEHDQANILMYTVGIMAIQFGNPFNIPNEEIEYKPDGLNETHVFWSIEEFTYIANLLAEHKKKELLYCDKLKQHANQLSDVEEIKNVKYGDAI